MPLEIVITSLILVNPVVRCGLTSRNVPVPFSDLLRVFTFQELDVSSKTRQGWTYPPQDGCTSRRGDVLSIMMFCEEKLRSTYHS
jgi:hypothetical protein